jgi:hypothetical protein
VNEFKQIAVTAHGKSGKKDLFFDGFDGFLPQKPGFLPLKCPLKLGLQHILSHLGLESSTRFRFHGRSALKARTVPTSRLAGFGK